MIFNCLTSGNTVTIINENSKQPNYCFKGYDEVSL